MDMSLPVLDGWEATRQIKADPATSAHPDHRADGPRHERGPRDGRSEAGCDDYDTKPVEFPRLIGKIDALLAATS